MEELIKELTQRNVLKNPNVLRAFQTIDRKDFVRRNDKDEAYGDYPLPIGHGQTISQPFTVAFMLDLLAPAPTEKILDVGSGSGWTTALLASAVLGGSDSPKTGRVIGVEIIPDLVSFSRENLAKYNLPNASIRQAARGVLGLPENAPYDKILVSAAANSIPEKLVAQLKIGGIMVIPVNNYIARVNKVSDSEIETGRYEGFTFVPLV